MAHANAYPRDLAIRVLTRVLSDHQPLDDALASVDLEQSRAWLQDVCSGTLRWKGRIDLILDSIALKKKPTGWLRKALSVAVYQLLAQEQTHPGAVVSETVAEVKRKEGQAPSQFANALLRKVADHAATWRALELKPGASAAEGARWASLPEWIWSRIVAERGIDWAKAYALASFERPKIWIRWRETLDAPAWAKPGPVPGSFELTEGGALTEKPGFVEGHFFVQDISSQLLVREISETVQSALGRKQCAALDLCAAPGGKSAGLAWNGFDVTSTDRDESRMKLLRQTAERVAREIRVIRREEVAALPAQDFVWVDSPCTGSGILRRHPDVRWLRQEKDLKTLNALQMELVREAWGKVKPGGFLAYSVCSVLEEEGAGALAKAGLPGAREVKRWFLVPQEAPHGDGFWAALLRKEA